MQFQHWNMKIEWDLRKCASTSVYRAMISHETVDKVSKNDKHVIKLSPSKLETQFEAVMMLF